MPHAISPNAVLVLCLAAAACSSSTTPDGEIPGSGGGGDGSGVGGGGDALDPKGNAGQPIMGGAAGASGGETSTAGHGGSLRNDAGSGHAGGDAAAEGGVPHTVLACNQLAAKGTWENITPPLTTLAGPAPCEFGGAFAIDAKNAGTVYLGSCNQGIWKTTDCGATWVHVNKGKNGDVLDAGRQWYFDIDPVESNILYTNTGFGAKSNGAFKSTNGGVDWEQMWPPSDPKLANLVDNGFAGVLRLDPANRAHVMLTFHAPCKGGPSDACIAESKDSGASWNIVWGRPGWVGGEGMTTWFLDSTTWLFGSQTNGLWRSTDAGGSWTLLDATAEGHGGGELYRATNGTFYLPVNQGILRSPDGSQWSLMKAAGLMIGLTGDGTTMWASSGFPWGRGQNPPPYLPFWSSAETDGRTWIQLASPKLSNGGQLGFESDHGILYASNLSEGFWRVVVK